MIAELAGFGKVAFDDNGRGNAIVFIHGFPLDRTLWSQQHISLASRARCISLDLPGFGESHSAATATSIEYYAGAAISLLDHLGVERATFCGLSMGGYVALSCWRHFSDRVAGLILCDTRATADSEEQKKNRDSAIELVRESGVKPLASSQIQGMLGKRTRETNPALVKWVLEMMQRQPADGVAAALSAMRDRPDSSPLLSTITVPVLIVVGEDDAITPPSDARQMLHALPQQARGQLDIIAGAGHASCVERPAAVTHAISDYLTSLAAESQ